jgi:hypothetical protein
MTIGCFEGFMERSRAGGTLLWFGVDGWRYSQWCFGMWLNWQMGYFFIDRGGVMVANTESTNCGTLSSLGGALLALSEVSSWQRWLLWLR